MNAHDHGSMMDRAPDNMFVSGSKHILGFVFFFFSTPIAIWIIVTILAPTIASVHEGGTKKFVGYLQTVQQSEKSMAVLANFSFGLFPEAWPYRCAEEWANRIAPEGQGSLMVDAEKGRKAFREKEADAPGGKVDGVAKVDGKLSSYLDDQFFPIQGALVGYGVTRLIYAAYLGIIFAPALLCAWFIGEYLSRRMRKANQNPMGTRHRLYKWIMNFSLTSVPAICILPFSMPSVLILLALFLATCCSAIFMRKHFVEI